MKLRIKFKLNEMLLRHLTLFKKNAFESIAYSVDIIDGESESFDSNLPSIMSHMWNTENVSSITSTTGEIIFEISNIEIDDITEISHLEFCAPIANGAPINMSISKSDDGITFSEYSSISVTNISNSKNIFVCNLNDEINTENTEPLKTIFKSPNDILSSEEYNSTINDIVKFTNNHTLIGQGKSVITVAYDPVNTSKYPVPLSVPLQKSKKLSIVSLLDDEFSTTVFDVSNEFIFCNASIKLPYGSFRILPSIESKEAFGNKLLLTIDDLDLEGNISFKSLGHSEEEKNDLVTHVKITFMTKGNYPAQSEADKVFSIDSLKLVDRSLPDKNYLASASISYSGNLAIEDTFNFFADDEKFATIRTDGEKGVLELSIPPTSFRNKDIILKRNDTDEYKGFKIEVRINDEWETIYDASMNGPFNEGTSQVITFSIDDSKYDRVFEDIEKNIFQAIKTMLGVNIQSVIQRSMSFRPGLFYIDGNDYKIYECKSNGIQYLNKYPTTIPFYLEEYNSKSEDKRLSDKINSKDIVKTIYSNPNYMTDNITSPLIIEDVNTDIFEYEEVELLIAYNSIHASDIILESKTIKTSLLKAHLNKSFRILDKIDSLYIVRLNLSLKNANSFVVEAEDPNSRYRKCIASVSLKGKRSSTYVDNSSYVRRQCKHGDKILFSLDKTRSIARINVLDDNEINIVNVFRDFKSFLTEHNFFIKRFFKQIITREVTLVSPFKNYIVRLIDIDFETDSYKIMNGTLVDINGAETFLVSFADELIVERRI